ncbi:hypothetical protein ES695_06915 [Candidatus Atribacteria bacterium 1244-E10-H5-B2]|nr:MAG: hypothetical protein ES695_06915 [Candidatus Atribacteria bacterium 1244-E10-H5-B2]
MNTRDKIISLLSQSKEPLGPKKIALELKKTSANIRKILSNLYKEGKIARVGYGEYILSYISSVNVKNKSVNVLGKSVNVLNKSVNVKNVSVNVEGPEAKKLINEEINKYRKICLRKLKMNDPEAYRKMRKARNRYLRDWRAENPDYNKDWLKAYHKKYPEKFREYQNRYWLKKALPQAGS